MNTTFTTLELSAKTQAAFKRRERRRLLSGLVFSAPFWVGFLLLTAIPMLASFYFSFTSYGGLTPPKWIGLKNYLDLPSDTAVVVSLVNTFVYAGLSIPLGVALGLLVAVLLNQKVRGVSGWRTIYYLPSVTPIVAWSLLWRWMLSRDYGVINALIGLVGIKPIDWLSDPYWIIIAFVSVSLFTIGTTMIVNLAGLQSIPTDLTDAARVDGAGPVRTFMNVTLPMMTPVLFYNLIMGIVGAMQSFSFFYILLTSSGKNLNIPASDTGAVYMLQLYRAAFLNFRLGYGSAMAWVLFVIIMIMTLFVVRTARSWVYYEGEGSNA